MPIVNPNTSEEQLYEAGNHRPVLGDAARGLCYLLYTLCERKKWAEEAHHYNALIVAWPEIAKLASQVAPGGGQTELF